MEQQYSFKQIAMIVCGLIIGLITLYSKYSNWQEDATNPIDPYDHQIDRHWPRKI